MRKLREIIHLKMTLLLVKGERRSANTLPLRDSLDRNLDDVT